MGLPRAVIFDFDGVLADSLGWHVKAWAAATKQLLAAELSDEMSRYIVGKSTRGISQYINQTFGHQSVDELMILKSKCVIDFAAQVPLFDGIRDFCDFLHKHDVPFGVASNAPKAFVQGVVAANKLPVAVVLGVEDSFGRPKPAPDLFLRCAKELGVPATEHPQVVVFEDSLHGIEAACTAGMFAIGVSTHADADALKAAGAKLVCAQTKDARAFDIFRS